MKTYLKFAAAALLTGIIIGVAVLIYAYYSAIF